MQQSRNYEPKISLRDILFHVLYHWRSLVVVALAGALVLSGYQYIQSRGKNDKEAWKKKLEDYQLNLDLYNTSKRNLEAAMLSSTEQIDALRKYQEGSLLMSINPREEWYAVRQYAVRTEESVEGEGKDGSVEAVLAFYTGLINQGLDPEQLKQLTGSGEEQYAREIITARPGIPVLYSGLSEQNTQEIIYAFRSFENNVITVEVRGGSEKMVREVMDYLAGVMNEAEKGESQKAAKHELVLLNADVQLRVDPELKVKQENLEVKIRSLQTGIQADQKALAGLTVPSKPTQNKVGKKTLIKYAIIGALLGAVALSGLYVFLYVLSGKLHLTDELRERYGLPVYGDFAHSRARKPGKGIDRLLEKWEFRGTVKEAQPVFENIGALIRENCTAQDVLLTGTVSQEKLEQIRNQLQELVKGCTITVGADYIHNAEAVQASKNAGSVLLVEEKQVSRVRDIDREAELLSINSAKVSGFIVL